MNFLIYLFVFALFAFVLFAFISLVRLAYIHIRAFVVRRKLSKLAETEKKDD